MKWQRIKMLHRIEMMMDILKNTREPEGITILLRKTNIKHVQITQLLDFLVQENLIRKIPSVRRPQFQITSEGKELLFHYYFLRKLFLKWEFLRYSGDVKQSEMKVET